MRFGIRTLIAVTTFVAVAFGFGPDRHRGAIVAYYLYLGLTCLLAVSIPILTSAFRDKKTRREQAPPAFALASACLGLVPFAAMWAFLVTEPHESWGDGIIRSIVAIAFYVTVFALPLAAITLFVSICYHAGVTAAPWLFALRVTLFLLCVLVPLVWYVLIMPGLG